MTCKSSVYRLYEALKKLQLSKTRAEEVCGNISELATACIDRSINHSEFSINTMDSLKIYEVFLSPLTDKKGILIGRLIVTYDITEKKREQQEHLYQQWKLAVIEERERMARDMHDNLGQVLGFINLQAQGIRQELMNAGIETVSYKLDKLVDITQSAHTEMREYIRNVRSPVYMEKDFITTLKKDIFSFEEQTGLNVKLRYSLKAFNTFLKPMELELQVQQIMEEKHL